VFKTPLNPLGITISSIQSSVDAGDFCLSRWRFDKDKIDEGLGREEEKGKE